MLGNMRMLTGDLSSARAFLEKSLAIRERLVRMEPTNVKRRRGLSGSYQKLGDLSLRLRNIQRAATYYQKQLATVEQTARITPADLLVERDLSVALDRLGDVSIARGDTEAARGWDHRPPPPESGRPAGAQPRHKSCLVREHSWLCRRVDRRST